MTTVNVSLNTIEKIKNFVHILAAYDCDFDLINGRYTVDAKSIMGILSLDHDKPLRLDIYTDDEQELSSIRTVLSEYLV